MTADYSCADEANGSGLQSCVGDVADGGAVDTSTLGGHTFTVQATDRAGNTGSKSVNYTVVDRTAPVIIGHDAGGGRGLWPWRERRSGLLVRGRAGRLGPRHLRGHGGRRRGGGHRERGQKTFKVEAADNAGNSPRRASPTRWSTGRPAISLTAPVEGAVYSLGQRVVAGPTRARTRRAARAWRAATGGRQRRADRHVELRRAHLRGARRRPRGQPASKVVTYTVRYDFDGFHSPLEEPAEDEPLEGGPAGAGPLLARLYRGPVPEAAGFPPRSSPAAAGRAGRHGEGPRTWQRNRPCRSSHGRKDVLLLEDREEVGGRLPGVHAEAGRRHRPRRERSVRGSRQGTNRQGCDKDRDKGHGKGHGR